MQTSMEDAAAEWQSALVAALRAAHGDQGSALAASWGPALLQAYGGVPEPRAAAEHIMRIEEAQASGQPILTLNRTAGSTCRCEIVSGTSLDLQTSIATLAHLGANVTGHCSHSVVRGGESAPAWIHEFTLDIPGEEATLLAGFRDAFLSVWAGDEDDSLNGLVLLAGLTAREVSLVRALTRYLRQVRPFAEDAVRSALLGHPDVAAALVRLVQLRFDPDAADAEAASALDTSIGVAIDAVKSAEDDQILRSLARIVQAMVRTNYFLVDASGRPKPCVAFKLRSAMLPWLPRPLPKFETFVYSPRVMGLHLRRGGVARGGIRWSDRMEDLRTEILGLMKAQMEKNAVIVPDGAKGGFVVKRPPERGGLAALQEEVRACYRIFLSGLLDLTDNRVAGEVVRPNRLVCHDEVDAYLVVAADKGTASFSDRANEVAAEYGYWLGDAFASGSSTGYHHQQLGITARGAWVSAERFLRLLGIDHNQEAFTVAGIGDMSGDVFGNAMLLSPHIGLVAAFNGEYVFLDPTPDMTAAYAERRRLFELGLDWGEYDRMLISPGGGVFRRDAKAIPISPEARDALGIDAESLAPAALIRALLRARVDLLFNGGVGTFVKSRRESHGDVSDEANDSVRIDADQLRCKIVIEGGNLGLTQLARIEYALCGGLVLTDATHNVAGVACSDWEVNIKILLSLAIANGHIQPDDRNQLLAEMTGEVVTRVLALCRRQTEAIEVTRGDPRPSAHTYARLIRTLGRYGVLDPAVECLPDEATLEERRLPGSGLVRPELAVVLAYTKAWIANQLLDTDLLDDPFLSRQLAAYFPEPLPQRFESDMLAHPLRRELVSTMIASQIVDRAGPTFWLELMEETGASASLLARAYLVAVEVLDLETLWAEVAELDGRVSEEVRLEILLETRGLIYDACRWLVRAARNVSLDEIATVIGKFRLGTRLVSDHLLELLDEGELAIYERRVTELGQTGVPGWLAARIAAIPWGMAAFEVVELADLTHRSQRVVLTVHHQLSSLLSIQWLAARVAQLPGSRDDNVATRMLLVRALREAHRACARATLARHAPPRAEDALEHWIANNKVFLDHHQARVAKLQSTATPNALALTRAVLDLVLETQRD